MLSSITASCGPIAPGSLSGISSGPEGTPAGGPSTHGRPVEKPQLNWTTAPWAFPAAWLPLILAAGIVVVPSGMGGIRVSQTAGTRPGTLSAGSLSFCRKSNRAVLSPPGQTPGPAERFHQLRLLKGWILATLVTSGRDGGHSVSTGIDSIVTWRPTLLFRPSSPLKLIA